MRHQRTARLHETIASAKHAVKSEDYWDFKPGERVDTVDGYRGTVTAVLDGPIAGAEAYDVTLDNDMGGGLYTTGQLRSASERQASYEVTGTAAESYPELTDILEQRPSPAKLASKQGSDNPTWEDDYNTKDGCTVCGDSEHDDHEHVDDSLRSQIDGLASDHDRELLRGNPTGPTKYSSLDAVYAFLGQAARDADFGFQVTAAWSDVRRKAQRIRSQGGVNVTLSQPGYIEATIQGDHHVYETQIMKYPGSRKNAAWGCGCKWGAYHWGAPDDMSRFAGRMCSHAYALHLEAQSQGMFGREVVPGTKIPDWSRSDIVRRYDIDGDSNVLASGGPTPLMAICAFLHASGEDPEEINVLWASVHTAHANAPFAEVTPNTPPTEPGPTKKPDPSDNPAQMGFLSQPDAGDWVNGPQSLDGRFASLDEAMFEPEIAKEGFAPLLALIPEIAAGAGAAGTAAGGAAAGSAAGGAAAGGAAAGGAGAGAGLARTVAPKVLPSLLPGGDKSEQDQGTDSLLDANGAEGQRSEDNQDANLMSIKPFASMHDHPEGALPSTDGDTGLGEGQGYSDGPGPSGGSLSANPIEGDLETDSGSIQTMGQSVADIVAQFQHTAGAQALSKGGVRAAEDTGDIAAAAQAHLAGLNKTAMDTFSPAEQAELIGEGVGVRASNMDRLEITGTHYEMLNDHDDDDSWMA